MEDTFVLMRKNVKAVNGETKTSWEEVYRGPEEACILHLKRNNRYWYDKETVVLFRVSYTPVREWRGVVRVNEEAL